jgi:putative endonuclease
MAEHNELGKKGEELACLHLKKNGYKILHMNWRHLHDEVDIIAEKENILVFVEVKTRSSNYFGEPYIFVNKKKQNFLIRAANSYFDKYDVDMEGRFDVISIIISADKHRIDHIERAFFPCV